MDDPYLDEILAELDECDPHCANDKCGSRTVTPSHWKKADAAERAELRADGYAAPGRRGLCMSCYKKAEYWGELGAYPEQPRGFAQGTRTKRAA